MPFFLEENQEKIKKAAHYSIEVAKVLVKDEEEKDRLIDQGHDYHFVTNIYQILDDKEI
ncbi:homoserine dehydrogenase, partial [Streptococcus suis]